MIKLKEISKFYYSETSATLGLRNVNLEFEKGEFVAITGESGSGKSTLLNVISGMDTYEDGELYYNGEETSYYNKEDWEEYRRNKVSLIYQSYNLIDSYTAVENIESVLLICEKNNGRMTKRQRRAKAMECLRMVGLEKQAKNRASHMSSGQKQRLGIARALAKNTDIIIADEPTGNLDIENGKQVMQILHELSKTKLVIVVTHNYEQAEPYATRKVRLYDGEIVENRILKPKYDVPDTPIDANEEHKIKDNFSIAKRFVSMNRVATPHRNIFIFTFMLMTALAMFTMTGIFLKNMDDSTMKKTSTTAFKNLDMNRIVVKNIYGTLLKEDDVYILEKLKYVESVDLYGVVADVNYFYKPDVDYKVRYKNEQTSKSISVELINYNRYMKSQTVIKEKDLAKGKLPTAFNEIVLYSDDESMLGKEIDVYFTNKNQWKNNYVHYSLKVVGLLKEETEQIYFSNQLCNSLSVRTGIVSAKVENYIRSVTTYLDGREDYIFDSARTTKAIFVLNPDLKGNEIRVTQNQFVKLKADSVVEGVSKTVQSVAPHAILQYEYPLTGESKEGIELKVLGEGHLSSDDIIEVSKEMFYRIYFKHHNEQITVYAKDYAYTTEVIKAINAAGYEAISAYRASAIDYDGNKIANQFKFMGIAAGTIIILFVLNVFVVYSLMKLKRGDFIILSSLGMSKRTVKQMNYYELITMMLWADVISIIGLNVLSFLKINAITSFIYYYRVPSYIFVVVLTVIMAAIAASVFSGHLVNKFKITSLKGE